MASMPVIETDCISSQQPPHYRGNGNIPGSQENMEMVGYQRPGVTARFAFAHNPGQSIYKIIAIVIVEEKFTPFYPPADDMVQRSGFVNSGLSWHPVYIS